MLTAFHPHWTSLPPSCRSSHQLTRKCHHFSREKFRFKPMPHPPPPLADFHIFIDSSVRGEIEDGGVALLVLSQENHKNEWRTPVVDPFRQRMPPSKKPSNGYPPFNHATQLSSSAPVSHWFRPLTTLTHSTCLPSNCRLRRQYSLCRNQS